VRFILPQVCRKKPARASLLNRDLQADLSFVEVLERHDLGGPHLRSLCLGAIQQPCKVQPAVCEIKTKFVFKAGAILLSRTLGLVDIDANLASERLDRMVFADESNDVRYRRVIEEIRVDLGDSLITKKDDRELALRTTPSTHPVQSLDYGNRRSRRDLSLGVLVSNGDGAGHLRP